MLILAGVEWKPTTVGFGSYRILSVTLACFNTGQGLRTVFLRLLYIFIATERAFYCEEIIICCVELQTG